MLELLNTLGVDTSGYNGLRLDWSLPPILWFALFALIAALIILANVRGTSPLDRPGRRIILWVLRAVGVLLLLGVMVDPALVMEQREPIRPRAVILWDTSRSMSLQSGSGSSTRMDQLKKFWGNAGKLRERLGKNYIVDVFGFDSAVNPLDEQAAQSGPVSPPRGGASARG